MSRKPEPIIRSTTATLTKQLRVEVSAIATNETFENPKMMLCFEAGTEVRIVKATRSSYCILIQVTQGFSIEVEVPASAIN